MTSTHSPPRGSKRILIIACAVFLIGSALTAALSLLREHAGEPAPKGETPVIQTQKPEEYVAASGGNDEVPSKQPIVAAPPAPSAALEHAATIIPGAPASDTSPPPSVDRVDKPAKPAPAKLLPASPAQRADIVAAVERADRAETKALRTLDATPLHATHVGKALNLLKDTVDTLSSRGLYMANSLVRANVENVLVTSEGRKAQVRTTETWASSYYDRKTNTCRAHAHERPMPQTIVLNRVDQTWMIADIKHDHNDPPALTHCHN